MWRYKVFNLRFLSVFMALRNSFDGPKKEIRYYRAVFFKSGVMWLFRILFSPQRNNRWHKTVNATTTGVVKVWERKMSSYNALSDAKNRYHWYCVPRTDYQKGETQVTQKVECTEFMGGHHRPMEPFPMWWWPMIVSCQSDRSRILASAYKVVISTGFLVLIWFNFFVNLFLVSETVTYSDSSVRWKSSNLWNCTVRRLLWLNNAELNFFVSFDVGLCRDNVNIDEQRFWWDRIAVKYFNSRSSIVQMLGDGICLRLEVV